MEPAKNPSEFFRRIPPARVRWRTTGTFFTLVACLFLTSCASAKLELHDTSFTGDQLVGSKMAVASVISKGSYGISSRDADAMLNNLATEIRKRRTKSTVAGISEFKRSAGSGSSIGAVSSSRKSRALRAGIRYLISIEVTSNSISTNVSESESDNTRTIYDEHGHAIGCEVVSTDYTTTSSARRSVTAKYKIYDLKLRKNVWISNAKHSLRNSNSNQSSFHYPPPPPFPPPPDAARVFNGMTTAAIRKLPRKGF